MADEYERCFGKPEGLGKRLIMWRRQLASSAYPWIGTGICDDLVAAAKALGENVSEFEKPADNLEFDL
jgi:hypothetical protein